jgi:hypothetical protein
MRAGLSWLGGGDNAQEVASPIPGRRVEGNANSKRTLTAYAEQIRCHAGSHVVTDEQPPLARVRVYTGSDAGSETCVKTSPVAGNVRFRSRFDNVRGDAHS